MILSNKEAQPVAAGGPNSGSAISHEDHIDGEGAFQSASVPVGLLDRPVNRTPSQSRPDRCGQDGADLVDRPEHVAAIDGTLSPTEGLSGALVGQVASDLASGLRMASKGLLPVALGVGGEQGTGGPTGLRPGVADMERPPMTNRGSLTPSQGVGYTGLHELKVTVFTGLEAIKMLMMDMGPVFKALLGQVWPSKSGGGHVDQVYDTGLPGLSVVTYRNGADYLSVHFKGQACEILGDEVLSVFLQRLGKTWSRWHATRIDAAWDRFGMTVPEFADALDAGQYRSRSSLGGWFMGRRDSAGDRTCYTHKTPEKRGLERYARCYDERGHVRMEFCLRHEQARAVSIQLAGLPVSKWGVYLTGVLRDFFDLVVCSPGERVDRAPLHPAWSDLVGAAERVRVRPSGDRLPERRAGQAVINRFMAAAKRAPADLLAVVDAFGWQGEQMLINALRSFHAEKVDVSYVQQLKRTGGGVDPEEPPF